MAVSEAALSDVDFDPCPEVSRAAPQGRTECPTEWPAAASTGRSRSFLKEKAKRVLPYGKRGLRYASSRTYAIHESIDQSQFIDPRGHG